MATTNDFLSILLGDGGRAKVLRVFIFNESRMFTAAEAAKRAGVSTREAARQIEELEEWKVIKKLKGAAPAMPKVAKAGKGKKKSAKKEVVHMWTLDMEFPHLRALSAFVHEVSPLRHEKIVTALKRGGRIAAVILSGSFMGDPSRPADLIVAADIFNERRLDKAIRELEPMFGREIRYAAFSTPEFRYRLTIQDRLLRDTLDYPHMVLLDKTRLL
ncbi:hypothetical protein C4568_01865 [Candidatus Parcubacteria bacterium]|nr:MAG: hypothetical protein C4568_01865 [Candidatus Parcubacteria bacterium]